MIFDCFFNRPNSIFCLFFLLIGISFKQTFNFEFNDPTPASIAFFIQ
jgi:hypothetical protein